MDLVTEFSGLTQLTRYTLLNIVSRNYSRCFLWPLQGFRQECPSYSTQIDISLYEIPMHISWKHLLLILWNIRWYTQVHELYYRCRTTINRTTDLYTKFVTFKTLGYIEVFNWHILFTIWYWGPDLSRHLQMSISWLFRRWTGKEASLAHWIPGGVISTLNK